jgi:hypothetical protein
MIWLILVFVWTIASVWYFIANLGNKNKKPRFPKCEYVFGLPVIIIAEIFNFLQKSKKL